MIEEKVINEINTALIKQGLNENAVTALRKKWPGIHFTYCSDDDVSHAKAVRESDGFNIYLIDSRNHCLCFTSSTEVATGLVLAQCEA